MSDGLPALVVFFFIKPFFYEDLTIQLLVLNHQTTHTYDLFTMVNAYAEPLTFFRTEYRCKDTKYYYLPLVEIVT